MMCKPGATTCKGQCSTGACSWDVHTTMASTAYLSVEVDSAGVTHIATTRNFKPSYHRVLGPGSPTSELVNSGFSCKGGTPSSPTETPPIVIPDGATGKAMVVCIDGNHIRAFTWDGLAWMTHWVFYNSATNERMTGLRRLGNRIAFMHFAEPGSSPYPLRTIQTALWENKRWSRTVLTSFGAQSTTLHALSVVSDVPGAAKVAWTWTTFPTPSTTVALSSQAGASFNLAHLPATAALVSGALSFAEDKNRNLVAATQSLSFHTYANGAWTSEQVSSGSANKLDLVVDARGVPRIAWSDPQGIHLATRIGSVWYVELVSAQSADIDLSVNANGKVVIGALTPSGFTVFD